MFGLGWLACLLEQLLARLVAWSLGWLVGWFKWLKHTCTQITVQCSTCTLLCVSINMFACTALYTWLSDERHCVILVSLALAHAS